MRAALFAALLTVFQAADVIIVMNQHAGQDVMNVVNLPTSATVETLMIIIQRIMFDQLEQGRLDFEHKLTHEEQAILRLLQTGRQNARSVKFLMEMTGLGNVEIRQTVKHLIEEHNVMIVSATSKPAGFFIPVTRDEFEAGARQIEHRIISLARRLRAINKQAYEEIFGQRNIFKESNAA